MKKLKEFLLSEMKTLKKSEIGTDIPKWAKYYAIDANGDVVVYEEEPAMASSFWFNNGDKRAKTIESANARNPSWKTSLRRLK